MAEIDNITRPLTDEERWEILEIRARAFDAAVKVVREYSGGEGSTIEVAKRFEAYLRTGKDKPAATGSERNG